MRVITRMSIDSTERKWMSPETVGVCACSQLRRTARRVSSLYDEILAGSGLTNTQHAVLVNVARAGTASRTELAERLGMDRTTLTRNLRPLQREKLLLSKKSEDRRERLLQLSAAGEKRLKQSYDRWEEAQRLFSEQVGARTLKQLRTLLEAAEQAAEQ